MEPLVLVLFVIGLVLLVAGAEILVRGASWLAAAAGISPLVIGLTVVAFGTSAPETAVSTQAALANQGGADIAVGNVVGSSICNILLILGLSAAITPLVVAQKLVRVDVPLMVGASLLVYAFALDGKIGRWNGLVLCAGIVAYTVFAIVEARRESRAVQEEYAKEFGDGRRGKGGWGLHLASIIGGVGLLVLGSKWLVDGAVIMARYLGVSELIIGLTIVAVGTSLPEIATSVMASLKGERDIAVGNVVGSNLFNLLCVLGLSALVAPDGVAVAPAALAFDMPVMIAASVACLPVFFTGASIARWEGVVFVGYYVAYTALLVLAATGNGMLGTFRTAMLFFALPLTLVTLAVGVVQQWRSMPGAAAADGEGGAGR